MQQRRLLVVDDDDNIREISSTTLELLGGWEVDTAAGGEEAIEAALSGQPDAILLDVMMPGMDGPATLAALRSDERTRGIPVVFLTAKVRPSEIERLSDLGAAAVLSKPFDPMGLATEISAALGWE